LALREGYQAFTCPTCGVVQGDFPLSQTLLGLAYEHPSDAVTATCTNEDLPAPSYPHWCRDIGRGQCSAPDLASRSSSARPNPTGS
jgi:hypothetical protein